MKNQDLGREWWFLGLYALVLAGGVLYIEGTLASHPSLTEVAAVIGYVIVVALSTVIVARQIRDGNRQALTRAEDIGPMGTNIRPDSGGQPRDRRRAATGLGVLVGAVFLVGLLTAALGFNAVVAGAITAVAAVVGVLFVVTVARGGWPR
jgi:hypothetical protein